MSVWVKATTIGGATSAEYVEVAVTLPAPCLPTVTPAEPLTIAVPYVDGDTINVAKQL